MAIDKTLIMNDVQQISRSGRTPYREYKLELFLLGGCYKVMKIIDITHDYDYIGGYGCEIMVTIAIGAGDVTNIMLNHEGPVKAKLYEICRGETVIQEYYAFIDKSGNPQTSLSLSKTNDGQLNNISMMYFTLQLIDANLFILKDELCGEAYRNCTVLDVMNAVFGYALNRVKTFNSIDKLFLEIIPPDNTKVYSQILLEHGMSIFDVPRYLQDRYGVYNYDIGYFYQNGTLYIYPPYNLNLFETTDKKVISYNIPANMGIGIDRTWRNDGVTIYMFNTQGMKNVNMVENNEVLMGNSVIKPSSSSLFIPSEDVTNSSDQVYDRSKNTVEYALSDRKDDLLNMKVYNDFSDNNFKFYSQMASKYGILYDIPWDSCINGVVYPGMPIKVIREYNSEYIEEYGVVFGFLINEKIRSGGFNDTDYVGNGVIRAFIMPRSIKKSETSNLSKTDI